MWFPILVLGGLYLLYRDIKKKEKPATPSPEEIRARTPHPLDGDEEAKKSRERSGALAALSKEAVQANEENGGKKS